MFRKKTCTRELIPQRNKRRFFINYVMLLNKKEIFGVLLL